MRRRLLLAAAAVLAGLTFGGCSTPSDARARRGSGIVASYAAPLDAVWSALPDLLKELGIRVMGQNAAEGYLLVETAGSGYGWSDRATIYVEPIGTRGNCRVEVLPHSTLGIDLTLGDWPKDIHKRLAQRFRRY